MTWSFWEIVGVGLRSTGVSIIVDLLIGWLQEARRWGPATFQPERTARASWRPGLRRPSECGLDPEPANMRFQVTLGLAGAPVGLRSQRGTRKPVSTVYGRLGVLQGMPVPQADRVPSVSSVAGGPTFGGSAGLASSFSSAIRPVWQLRFGILIIYHSIPRRNAECTVCTPTAECPVVGVKLP
jgi:hypothetical protein